MRAADETVVDFSIVIPVYYNEGALTGTMASLLEEVIRPNAPRTCEVIFVDDGSGDRSLAELLQIREQHPAIVRIAKLTRNFGQLAAVKAGMAMARGKCLVVLSADGQDPVGLINEMIAAFFDDGCEIVVCHRDGRDESYEKIITSRIFYWLMRRLSFPQMPRGGFDYFLLSRRTTQHVLACNEVHGFLQGQILATGFKTKFIGYRRREREIGTSRWTFGKKLTYLIDGVVGYSFAPIRAMSAIGLLAAVSGFIYAVVIVIKWLSYSHPVEGWVPIMCVLLVMGGLQMLMAGIAGEYLWRTLAQVRQRKAYIIETVYENAAAGQGDFEEVLASAAGTAPALESDAPDR